MNDPVAIDYQPLLAMRGLWWRVIKVSLHTLSGWAVLLVSIAAAVAGLISFDFLLVALGPALYGVWLSTRFVRYKADLWQAFALANNWPLDITTPPEELVSPSMQFGHDFIFSPVIQALLGEVSGDLFTYQTTTGDGRSQVIHYFTVARVALPVSLPHMLLLSKKAKADVQRDLVDAENLQLEGDFDDYFSLQIERGQQIDVLELITPEVMQTLVQYNQAEDIEILGDDLYFILNRDRRDYQDVQHLIESVVALCQRIMENIRQDTVMPESLPPAATENSTSTPSS